MGFCFLVIAYSLWAGPEILSITFVPTLIFAAAILAGFGAIQTVETIATIMYGGGGAN